MLLTNLQQSILEGLADYCSFFFGRPNVNVNLIEHENNYCKKHVSFFVPYGVYYRSMGSGSSKKKKIEIVQPNNNLYFIPKEELDRIFDIPFNELEFVHKMFEWKYYYSINIHNNVTIQLGLVKYQNGEFLARLSNTHEISNRERFDVFAKEIESMRKLRHPNLIPFIGCALEEPEFVMLFFDHCQNESVKEFVKKERLSISQKFKILHSVADVIGFLAQNGVIHEELNWDFVFLDENLDAKVFGFGLTSKLERAGLISMTRHSGKSDFLAPEITISADYKPESMIFSFGIMMYMLLVEDFNPYGEIPEFKVQLKTALEPEFRPPIDEKIKNMSKSSDIDFSWIVKLTKRCWGYEMNDRPSAQEILDCFNENVDFKDPMILKDLNERTEFLKNGGEIIFEKYTNCEPSNNKCFVDLKVGGDLEIQYLPKILLVEN